MTGQCEYLSGPERDVPCLSAAVVTVRVDPALFPDRRDVVVGTFCEAHARYLHHHTITTPIPHPQETEHA